MSEENIVYPPNELLPREAPVARPSGGPTVSSPTVDKITAALCAAMAEMGEAVKDKVNPHFKSKYADLSAFVAAAKPALLKNGIVPLQFPMPSPSGTARVLTRLQHVSGEWFQCDVTASLPKNDPQGLGSAITYLRRYSLAAMTGLSPEDDDGNESVKATPIAEVKFAKNEEPKAAKVTSPDTPVPPKSDGPSSESAIQKLMEALASEKAKSAAGLKEIMEQANQIKKTWPGVDKTDAWKAPQAAFKAALEAVSK